MDGAARTLGVRLTLRSASLLVAGLASTLLVLRIAESSQRVIAWVLSAAAVAVLVHPVIALVDRVMPRGVAVLLVAGVMLAIVGLTGRAMVDDVSRETRRLQEAAPRRAAELEESGRFSDLARELELRDRVERLVDAIPDRLRGGTTADAIRSAANRGLAFVAATILAIFFVLYGPRIIDGGIAQLRDPIRRSRADAVVRRASGRAFGYARGMLAEALVEGVLAWMIAGLAGVPGPAALGVWVGLWSVVPVVGVLVGALPVVVFAAAASPARAVVVALAFVAIGVVEWQVVKPRLERATVQLGGFLTVAGAFGGLELYGLSGALLGVLGAALAVAVVQEMGRDEAVWGAAA